MSGTLSGNGVLTREAAVARVGHAAHPRQAVGRARLCAANRGQRRLGGQAEVEWGVEARPQGDHAGHSGGVAGGQRLGEVATAAVAKEGDRSATLAMDQLEALVESVEGAVGAVDVEADPRAARNVADAPEPAREHPERLLSGEEAGDEDHVRSVAGRHASPAEDRVDEQAGQLRLPAQLAHVGAPPAALGRVLCLRRERVEAGVLDAIGHVQRWLAPVGHGSRRVRLPRRAAAQTAPGDGSAVAWVATPDAPERQPELSMSFVLPSSTMPTTGVLLERDVRLERCRLPHLQAAPERARRRPRDRLHAHVLGTVHGDARRELLEVLRADQRGHGHDDPGPSVPHARAPGAVVADDLALPVVEVDPLPKYATLLSRLQIAY